MDYQELSSDEKITLGALVRALIRIDGRYTKDESDRLRVVAAQLGDPETFFAKLHEAAERVRDSAELDAAARSVTRTEARELMLEVLLGIGAAEAALEPEARMLNELRAMWSIE
jgi:Tellurite resistance protein TerB